MADYEITVHYDQDSDDYLIIEIQPGGRRILATCPYLAYAHHIASALKRHHKFDFDKVVEFKERTSNET